MGGGDQSKSVITSTSFFQTNNTPRRQAKHKNKSVAVIYIENVRVPFLYKKCRHRQNMYTHIRHPSSLQHPSDTPPGDSGQSSRSQPCFTSLLCTRYEVYSMFTFTLEWIIRQETYYCKTYQVYTWAHFTYNMDKLLLNFAIASYA